MACFLAPTVEAVIVSIVKRKQKRKEEELLYIENPMTDENKTELVVVEGKIPFSRKLGWLSNMLWGGSYLLAIEHIWHGEIVPWVPFLTALDNQTDIIPMLQEIASVGTAMSICITLIWVVMLAVVHGWETQKDCHISAEVEG